MLCFAPFTVLYVLAIIVLSCCFPHYIIIVWIEPNFGVVKTEKQLVPHESYCDMGNFTVGAALWLWHYWPRHFGAILELGTWKFGTYSRSFESWELRHVFNGIPAETGWLARLDRGKEVPWSKWLKPWLFEVKVHLESWHQKRWRKMTC